jgi:hypothetical protein
MEDRNRSRPAGGWGAREQEDDDGGASCWLRTTKSGQNTRYPLLEPEVPRPVPEIPETTLPDLKFGS